uniref:Uncharacterized protein n=1 Tax=Siphoviridae sp. ctNHj22 TaxID=2825468 RepID=A0A8S5VG56_9CAUD|nr:MAG TPA: hypothetical protein [Siphoviridae sp. ctNHj22]
MRQRKLKLAIILSNGAEFFCAIFCLFRAIYFEGKGEYELFYGD